MNISKNVLLLCMPTALLSLNIAQNASADSNPLSSGASVTVPTSTFLFANPETGTVGRYDSSGDTSIGNFPPEMWGKQIMILMGADYTSEDSAQSTIYGDKFFKNNVTAKYDHSQNPFQDYSRRLIEFSRKANLSKECVALKISANMPLTISTPDPSLCKVESNITNNEYLIRGFACFINIAPLLSVRAKAQTHSDCSKQQIQQGEILGTIGYFTAGDASGNSSDLTTLGLTRFRMTISAPQTIPRQMSYDGNAPAWPTRMLMDMHLANLALHVTEQGTEILPSVLLDNRCSENILPRWANTSSCQYAAPFGAQIYFSELSNNGKWHTSDAWYGGGVVSPQWKGIMPIGQHRSLLKVQPGGRYKVSINANYPDTYYRLSLKQNSQWLIDAQNTNINTNADLLPILSSVKTINDISGARTRQIPTVDVPTPTLRQGSFGDLTRFVDNLNALVGMSSVWPPFLQEVCDVAQSSCQRVGKFIQQADVEFTVESIDTSGAAILKNLNIRRVSNLTAQSALIESSELPQVNIRWFE